MSKFPKVNIEFCAKCKWHNRAIWYVQEILQTFSKPGVNLIEDISVQPRYDFPGLFRIVAHKNENESKILYLRRFKSEVDDALIEDYVYEGFPDSKFLKTLLRDYLFPDNNLGHIDRGTEREVLNQGKQEAKKEMEKEGTKAEAEAPECVACKV